MFFLQPAKIGFMISFEKFYGKKPQIFHEKIGFFFLQKVKQEKIIDLLNYALTDVVNKVICKCPLSFIGC